MINRSAFLVVFLFGAVAAQGQEPRERERGREVIRDRVQTFFGPGGLLEMRRPRLGIVVNLAADLARDSIGAQVESVTPGGPAERAGVRAGDVITRMNGVRLGVSDPADADDFESRPGRRLINLASRLNPGDTVRLEVRREGRPQSFTFTAAESDLDLLAERLRVPLMAPGGPDQPGRMVFAWGGGGVRDLELVKVGPELASNLGVSEGLLVVDVGQDTALGLRPGDVIVTIGGRRPTSPAHAMRIFSSYEASEQVQFEVMRQRRRVTVTGRIPQAGSGWRIHHNSFEIEVPRMKMLLAPLRDRLQLHLESPRLRLEAPRRMRVEAPAGLAPRRIEGEI